MKRRDLIGLGLSSGLIATLTFVACRGPKPGPPAITSNTTSPSVQPPVMTHPTTPPTPSVAASASAAAQLAQAVSDAKSCATPKTIWANRPDGGVVFVNAWHRKDAGNIDRLQGVVDALATRADTFRCCFDVWAATAGAGSEGRLLLELELSPDGEAKSVKIDPARSDVNDEVSQACIVAVAKEIEFPASPSGVSTLVEYPFVVQSAP